MKQHQQADAVAGHRMRSVLAQTSYASPQQRPSGRKPIREADVQLLAPFLRNQFRQLALSGAISPATALEQVFTIIYGKSRTPSERLLFLSVAATLVRQVSLEIAPMDERVGPWEISVTHFREWFARLDAFQPVTAKIIDLRCFANLSVKEIAALTGLPSVTVARTLRATVDTLRSRPSTRTGGGRPAETDSSERRHKHQRDLRC